MPDPPFCAKCVRGELGRPAAMCEPGCSCVPPSAAAVDASAHPAPGDALQLSNCSSAAAFHWHRVGQTDCERQASKSVKSE